MSYSTARDKQFSEETKRREALLVESQQNYNRELAAHAAAVQSLNVNQQKYKALQEGFKVIAWKFVTLNYLFHTELP